MRPFGNACLGRGATKASQATAGRYVQDVGPRRADVDASKTDLSNSDCTPRRRVRRPDLSPILSPPRAHATASADSGPAAFGLQTLEANIESLLITRLGLAKVELAEILSKRRKRVRAGAVFEPILRPLRRCYLLRERLYFRCTYIRYRLACRDSSLSQGGEEHRYFEELRRQRSRQPRK